MKKCVVVIPPQAPERILNLSDSFSSLDHGMSYESAYLTFKTGNKSRKQTYLVPRYIVECNKRVTAKNIDNHVDLCLVATFVASVLLLAFVGKRWHDQK